MDKTHVNRIEGEAGMHTHTVTAQGRAMFTGTMHVPSNTRRPGKPGKSSSRNEALTPSPSRIMKKYIPLM